MVEIDPTSEVEELAELVSIIEDDAPSMMPYPQKKS